MKNWIEMGLEQDTLLSRGVDWYLDRCDHWLGRRDEAMALAYIIERALLAVAGLWWLWCHSIEGTGAICSGLMLLPVVVLARRKR